MLITKEWAYKRVTWPVALSVIAIAALFGMALGALCMGFE